MLSALPYYGPEDVVCTDGSSIELAFSADGKRYAADQHSCAGKTEINRIAAKFRELALKYDPDFTDLLYGLKD